MYNFQRLCTEIITHYADYPVIFADGSVRNRSTGFVFILSGSVLEFQLNTFSFIFTAELLALCKTIQAVRNFQPGKCLLFVAP
jgi:hypothetical protein